ncbi:endonuclease domain-containing protein [Mangrovimonas aestuarii]|uniref:endonuclease domain-containing protein n=1 Tax=Mangrovimonas aestuarii TaxID=3018443 RepID=UPI002379E11D|nr:endonuclease domain-containing protein [Mangrovimonas aestuarii]
MKSSQPYHDESMFKGAPAENFRKAELLRQNTTESENKLWLILKDGQFEGYKFRRQHPIHLFIVDFYCHELRLVIEVDGGYHNSQEQHEADNKREELLKFQDLRILRFKNEDVLDNLDEVVFELKQKIEEIKA